MNNAHQVQARNDMHVVVGTTLLRQFVVPVCIENISNARMHWSENARKAKIHRTSALYAAMSAGIRPLAKGTAKITLTRIFAGRRKAFDSDGLAIACKSVRDGLADALGIDDGSDRLEFCYLQVRGDANYVSVQIQIGG